MQTTDPNHNQHHAPSAPPQSAVLRGPMVGKYLKMFGSDGTLSSLLGLDRDEDFVAAEREEADLLVLISPNLTEPLLTESMSNSIPDQRTTKTVHLERLGASEKANAVSPLKWNWNKSLTAYGSGMLWQGRANTKL